MDWQQVIEAHNHSVVLSLLARGVRLKRARELAHETWALLFEKHRAGLLPIVHLPGLAIRQAAFLSMHERPPRDASLEATPEVLTMPDAATPVDVRLEAREHLVIATATLDGCSPRAQQLFGAALASPDEPHAALAARAGVSVQRFRQTLCEVRARLRTALAGGDEP